MVKHAKKGLIFILLTWVSVVTYGQQQKTVDFYQEIKKIDFSTILNADSILNEDREGGKEKLKRPEILGFIGSDFQRLHIHFISIIKNTTNPYQYFAYGKTMVKGNICSFQGTITITEAKLYSEAEIPNINQGFVTSELIFYEDQKQPSTGLIKGKLTTQFLIDKTGNLRYDAIMLIADGYSNNQFIGTWMSYKTGVSKKCNWGDYRIPESKLLDVGAGEFSVDQKYRKNGWENFNIAWNTYPETAEVRKAKEKEMGWWK